jgi:hypothetical protein
MHLTHGIRLLLCVPGAPENFHRREYKMHKSIFISILVVVSILLAGCGSAATPVDTTTAQPVNIKMETNPDPDVMGDTEVIFTLTDANGEPIEGATVDVSAEHTGMSGMDMSGLATEQGSGKYAINTNFSMSGDWKVTVYVRKDGLDYKEEIEFPVQ